MGSEMNPGATDNLEAKKNEILKLGRSFGYWTHGHSFPRQCRQIFQDIDLEGKNMLEIGCGKGVYSIWASIHGARRVVGLEPLEEGSFDSSAVYSDFEKMVKALRIKNIKMLPLKIQDYKKKKNEKFDLVLSVASINHLDEDSCVNLRKNAAAREIYKGIFRDIAKQMNKGGKLIILDCSNRNFFADVGLTNPMGKSIEWFKHESPEFWAELLSECGFAKARISWPSGRYLRFLNIFNRSKWMSYFMNSFFRLEMTFI